MAIDTSREFQVYCGAGQYYAIGNDAVYEVSDADNTDDLSFMSILNYTPVYVEFGEKTLCGEQDILHCYGKEVRCNLAKTSISPDEVDILIPHFRVGLGKDDERHITEGLLIYHRKTLYGEMFVKVLNPCHIRYELRKHGDITSVQHIMTTNMTGKGLHINRSEAEGPTDYQILNEPDRVEGDAYEVRAFFEDSEVFGMNYGVKFPQYFANLSAWLTDCYECGYPRS